MIPLFSGYDHSLKSVISPTAISLSGSSHDLGVMIYMYRCEGGSIYNRRGGQNLSESNLALSNKYCNIRRDMLNWVNWVNLLSTHDRIKPPVI